MAHPNEDLVRESFAAQARGDMDMLEKRWTDDVRYRIPGHHPTAGDYRGAEQVRQFYARVAEQQAALSIEVNDVLASDELAVALITVHGERAGKQMSEDMISVFRFRDGKLAEVRSYSGDQAAVDEFYS
jgi:ketosteroid isomerase-like protein